ncbi:MAG: S1/P1 Nuclease [Candidatus Baltobacteraceae bacterium]
MTRSTTLYRTLGLLLLLVFGLAPLRVSAWGEKGHEMINDLAAANLPAELPAFTRTQAARRELRYLGPEMDRLKGSGKSWDADRDPGHYLDIDDSGKIAGIIALSHLPPSMAAYETALLAAHTTPYRVGYLPYSIADGWEQLRTDFALWRVDRYEAQHATTAAARLRAAAHARLRATLTLRDIGVWGHFVADGSQPLHVTTHFNGWGSGPNPEHFPPLRGIHSQFESAFVDRFENEALVQRDIPAYRALDPQHRISQSRLLSIVGRYLRGTNAAVVPLYRIAARGGFSSGSSQARAFTALQLARGATMLRNLIAYAWEDSLNEKIGYPAVSVRAVLSGRARMPH